MLDQNKEIARKDVEECWNQGKVDRLDQYVTKDCRYHDPVFPSLATGLDSIRQHINTCRSGFPDLRFTIDDMIAERDEVVAHWTARGTHQGTFLGVAPTKKSAQVSGTSICRIKNGKISEQYMDWNLLTLLEQLGVASAAKLHMAAR
jgi:steroid delta-isomerase-like uncharacterized protein